MVFGEKLFSPERPMLARLFDNSSTLNNGIAPNPHLIEMQRILQVR